MSSRRIPNLFGLLFRYAIAAAIFCNFLDLLLKLLGLLEFYWDFIEKCNTKKVSISIKNIVLIFLVLHMWTVNNQHIFFQSRTISMANSTKIWSCQIATPRMVLSIEKIIQSEIFRYLLVTTRDIDVFMFLRSIVVIKILAKFK